MAKKKLPWWFRFGKRKKQSPIDPTLPFDEQIEELQRRINRRRDVEQAKRTEPKPPKKTKRTEPKPPKKRSRKPKEMPNLHLGEIIFSEEESRKVLFAWLYATDPKVKQKLYMLMLLSMNRTVQQVAEVLEVPVTDVLDAIKYFQTMDNP